MDFHSLAASHMAHRRRPAPRMDASAEDRYYRDRVTLPHPSLRLLASIATAAGVILLLVDVARI